MKSIGTRVAGFAFGMLVVIFIFHPDRFGSIWWQTYSDPGGNFSIKFPSKPQVSDLPVRSVADGDVVLHMVAATPNKTTSYLFEYFDDPRFASKTVEEVLNRGRDGAILGAHGALLDEQRIQIDGHQAREVQGCGAGNSIFSARLIADGQRLAILMVGTTSQKVDSKNAQRFFDSLKLSN